MGGSGMKRKLSLFLIAFGAFIVIYPVIFLLAGSFMHPAELEEHLAPIVSPASQGFADWSLLPQISDSSILCKGSAGGAAVLYGVLEFGQDRSRCGGPAASFSACLLPGDLPAMNSD